MENIFKGKEGRNSLIFLISCVFIISVVLLWFGISQKPNEEMLIPEISRREAAPKEITLLFAGDIMLSRAVGAIMEKLDDWKYPFLETGEFLRNADVTLGNLEGPISKLPKVTSAFLKN